MAHLNELPALPAAVPSWVRRLHFLSPAALKLGVHIIGGPGTGKSRLMGRILAWMAWLLGFPVVVLDPTGGIVLNIVDKIARLPRPLRRKLWPRLLHVDVGATDYVVRTPLYTRQYAGETLFAAANRLPAVLKRQDPHLQSAPILGWNSLYECAIYAGQIAVALGRQVDFVADLIAQPRTYKEELRQALAEHPELAPAVAYFRELMDPTAGALRERRTGSFANKLLPFLSDEGMLAAFAAVPAAVDWEKVVRQRQLVIIDFQHEQDPERRQFKLIWWFRSLVDFVKWRGLAGRGQEICFFIDEVTQLLGQRTGEGHSILAEDIEELGAVLGRNAGVNVCIGHQNLFQIDERIRNTLMQLGTQVIGNIANPDDALFLARQFMRYDPYQVKKHEPVWMSVPQMNEYGTLLDYSWPEIIDYRVVEFSPEEQLLLAMEKFRLPRFQFLVRPATAEGTVARQLYRMSIENLDRGQYPDAQALRAVLALLRQKDGVPLQTILAEIRSRRSARPEAKQKQVKSPAPAGILEDKSSPSYDTTQPPSAKPERNPVQPPAGAPADAVRNGDDEFWR